MENQNLEVLGASLPILGKNLKPDLRLIRDKKERLYFVGIVAFNVFVFALLSISLFVWPREAMQFVLVALLALILDWVAWKVTFPSLYGNSVRIGPNQYPYLYRIFRAASDSLEVREPILLDS